MTTNMRKSPEETLHEISEVTQPMENTLKKLAENPLGSPTGREQAEKNMHALDTFHQTGAQIVQALQKAQRKDLNSSNAPSTPGMGSGSHTSSSGTNERR